MLIVDDELPVVEALSLTMTKMGYSVLGTTSPRKAMRLLREHEVSVLISDLHMPDISGVEILIAAHDYNPHTVTILISGAGTLDATIRAVNDGGIWKYIEKPWSPTDLRITLAEAAELYEDRKQSSRALEILRRADNKPANIEQTAYMPKHHHTARVPDLQKDGGNDDLLAGRYRLEEMIAEGGSGRIFKGTDDLLGTPVAIKVLPESFSEDSFAVQTLKDEARIAMKLSHRHIVRLHNIQRVDQGYFLVMEYVDGCTLRDLLMEDGPLTLDIATKLMKICADALSFAHRRSIIHKDLKLDNIMLDSEGVIKIIDFGIACVQEAQEKHEGLILGTPYYMSPEQKRGEGVDLRTDVYSFGMIMYEMMTATLPFPADASEDDIMTQDPLPLSGVPAPIIEVLECALSPDRNNRYADMNAFAQAYVDALPLCTA